MSQRLLFNDYDTGGTIRERFEKFHRANPHVYELIRSIALDMKRRGFERCGMRTIYGRLRWEHAIETKGREVFKLNDHFTPHYSRMLMEEEPELEGFFELRKLKR